MAAGCLEVGNRDGTLILTLSHAPSNGLTPVLRQGLLAALETGAANCRAIVLAGAGVNFSSLLPMEPDTSRPALSDLCDAIAGAKIPVVAALHGLTMGPGAELALAATARIGAAGSRIAFPEVALGLCPAAGSTRRLPQLIGAGAALRLLLTGRVVPVAEAVGLGLVDEIADGALLAAALTLAGRLAEGHNPIRRSEAPSQWQAAVAAARRAQVGALPAARRIIDCVEAALLLPPESAARFEAVARSDLEATPEAAALCAAARAERRAAALPPAVARVVPLPMTALGLIGEAPALITLARAAIGQRIPVRWLHPQPGTLGASLGLPTADTDLLRIVEDAAGLMGSALQVHATSPGPGPLRRMPDGAALVVLDGAEGEMGLTIAPSARACELSVLAEEAPQAIATAIAGLRRLQLLPLLVGQRPGVGRAVIRAGDAALARMVGLGVPQRQLSAALSAFGLRLPTIQPNPAPRDMAEVEIRNRWLFAMANEGLRLLDAGIARRPCDIDHALVAGHGFPRWLGGPMHQGERRGLMVLRHDLRRMAEDDAIWSPAPLLDRLIQDGLRLSTLDGGA